MQTNFSIDQLADPDIQHAEDILRKCVHCGFCTATCPTYVLLGDELDSPRGRIYLIKNMLEKSSPVSAKVVKHIDRCLSCLGCMTTCPSGVNYMHLVDRARSHINDNFRRPFSDRVLRAFLALVLPNPRLFRLMLASGKLAKVFKPLMPRNISNLLSLVPTKIPRASNTDSVGITRAQGKRKYQVALLPGCAQRVLDPEINEATIRLLARHGCDVAITPSTGCCGAITHHMGKTSLASGSMKANILAWTQEIEEHGLDAIITNTSGCGTMLKDYGHVFQDDESLAKKAQEVSNRIFDISEFLAKIGIAGTVPLKLTLAYHSACSLQHGQGVHQTPKDLLSESGFNVIDIPEGHLCCGSAGTYNMLQPDLASRLLDRKLHNISMVKPDVIAAGNIGCITQLSSGTETPVVHTVQLLDWATGGPVPAPLQGKHPLINSS